MLPPMIEWVWAIAPTYWLAIGLALSTLLLLIGWRGRRIERSPTCPKCNSQIQQLNSESCPQCGVAFTSPLEHSSYRRRRALPLLLGLGCLLGVGLPAVWVFSDASWRTKAPTWALSAALDFGDESAAEELTRRLAAGGGAGEAEIRSAVARALTAQRIAPSGSSRLRGWLGFLGQMDDQDLLNDREWELMTQQCVRGFSARVRERCREDMPLPFEFVVDLAAPPSIMQRWVATLKRGSGENDDAVSDPVELQIEPSLRKLVTIQPQQRFTTAIDHRLSPGDHSLHIELTGKHAAFGRMRQLDEYHALSARPSRRPAIREAVKTALSQKRSTRSEVEEMMESLEALTDAARPAPHKGGLGLFCRVVAASSGDDCEPARGPDVVRELKSAIAIKKTTSKHNRSAFGGTLQPYQAPLIRISKALPYAVSFEVIAVHRGEESSFGTVWFPSNTASGDWPLENPKFRRMSDDKIRLILRPNPEPLRTTLDTRYADEVLEFDGVDLSTQ